MSNFFHRLRNMLDAIAYAEAGDLDAVKRLLQQRSQAKPASEPPTREVGGLASAV